MGELGNVYDLWLTLSPLVRDEAALAPVATPVSGVRGQGRAAPGADALADRPVRAPTPTAAPPVAADAVAHSRAHPRAGGGGQARTGDRPQRAGGAGHGVRRAGTGGRRRPSWSRSAATRANSGSWSAAWTGGKDGVRDDLGWVRADLVDVQGVDVSRLPPRAAPPKPTPTPRSLSTRPAWTSGRRSSIAMSRGTRSSTTCGRGRCAADGAGLAVGLTFSWPGGAVRCPGDQRAEGGWLVRVHGHGGGVHGGVGRPRTARDGDVAAE